MRPSPAGWAAMLLAAPSLWFLVPDAGSDVAALTGPDFLQAAVALASLVQVSVAAWVSAIITVGVACGSCSTLHRLTPRVLRRALFAGTATALTLAPTVGVCAADEAPSRTVSGLPFPDRPASATRPPRATVPSVIVRPGDTLWAIATRALPSGATAADIAQSVARWHVANREVVGPDPDLILPSQHLNPPPAKDYS